MNSIQHNIGKIGEVKDLKQKRPAINRPILIRWLFRGTTSSITKNLSTLSSLLLTRLTYICSD